MAAADDPCARTGVLLSRLLARGEPGRSCRQRLGFIHLVRIGCRPISSADSECSGDGALPASAKSFMISTWPQSMPSTGLRRPQRPPCRSPSISRARRTSPPSPAWIRTSTTTPSGRGSSPGWRRPTFACAPPAIRSSWPAKRRRAVWSSSTPSTSTPWPAPREAGTDLVFVAIRADNSSPLLADFEILQSGRFADDRNRFWIPFWPQPGLVPRDPARGTTLERVAYMGRIENLHPEFRGEQLAPGARGPRSGMGAARGALRDGVQARVPAGRVATARAAARRRASTGRTTARWTP